MKEEKRSERKKGRLLNGKLEIEKRGLNEEEGVLMEV